MRGAISMKNSKKAMWVGIAATAAVVTIAAVLAYEEDAVDRVGSYLNRQRLKVKFKGNGPILKVIDALDDNEIDTLLNIFDRTGSLKDSALDTWDDVKDKAVDYKEHIEDKLK